MSDIPIKFAESLFELELGNSSLNTIKYQEDIFIQMATHITKYLDIKKDYFVRIIQFIASEWQNEGETPFRYFENASPQERLQVAVIFSENILNFLVVHLNNPDDRETLKKIIEKATEYYMDQFAIRDGK